MSASPEFKSVVESRLDNEETVTTTIPLEIEFEIPVDELPADPDDGWDADEMARVEALDEFGQLIRDAKADDDTDLHLNDYRVTDSE